MSAVNRSCRREGGFTLVELLVVIVVIAILAAIAIPTYFGARAKAHDAAAFTLIRNALTAVESANISVGDYTLLSAAQLSVIEPSIHWIPATSDLVDATGPTVFQANITARADAHEVNFYPETRTRYDIAARAASGNFYAIEVETGAGARASYVKVRVIEGETDLGW